jgi:L,D-transpeptidase-like protein/putative peptidoglycan binding protein
VFASSSEVGEAGTLRGSRTLCWLAAGALMLALAAMLVLAASYFYARSQSDVIAGGTRVGATELGGLSPAAARVKLAQAYRALNRPLVISSRGGRLLLTAKQANVSVDSSALVDRALVLSRRGWFLVRAWRELTGGQVKANLHPRVGYSHTAVERIIRELQRRIDRRPVNAMPVPSFDRLTVRGGRRGVAVAAGLLRREIVTTLVTPQAPRLIGVPVRDLRPRITLAVLRRRYPAFITIDRAGFRLRLYRHLRLVRSYPIAVGQLGLKTPEGLYHIQDKVVNPSWQVPFSSWTGSLAGRLIAPGPDDPLKARWLGIFNGAGIHGTDETWSIGHAVSHGCVRMTIPEVINLYNQVSVGTPVYIGD